MFAAAHLTHGLYPTKLVVYFLFGLGLATIVWRTGSLHPGDGRSTRSATSSSSPPSGRTTPAAGWSPRAARTLVLRRGGLVVAGSRSGASPSAACCATGSADRTGRSATWLTLRLVRRLLRARRPCATAHSPTGRLVAHRSWRPLVRHLPRGEGRSVSRAARYIALAHAAAPSPHPHRIRRRRRAAARPARRPRRSTRSATRPSSAAGRSRS